MASTTIMKRKDHLIQFTSDTLTLEGVLSHPAEAASIPGAVICHPHPNYGGDMDNSVVIAVSGALDRLDMAVLRFNFRGVNGSQGIYDGGEGEVNDAIAALSFLASQAVVDRDRLFLVGYSFGALVGLRAALRGVNLKAVAAISPPVAMFNFGFLSKLKVPFLVVSGDSDPFCGLAELENVYNAISAPKEKIVFPSVDHFYWGTETAAGEAVMHFFHRYTV